MTFENLWHDFPNEQRLRLTFQTGNTFNIKFSRVKFGTIFKFCFTVPRCILFLSFCFLLLLPFKVIKILSLRLLGIQMLYSKMEFYLLNVVKSHIPRNSFEYSSFSSFLFLVPFLVPFPQYDFSTEPDFEAMLFTISTL